MDWPIWTPMDDSLDDPDPCAPPPPEPDPAVAARIESSIRFLNAVSQGLRRRANPGGGA